MAIIPNGGGDCDSWPLEVKSVRIFQAGQWRTQPIQQNYQLQPGERIEFQHGFVAGANPPTGTRLKLQIKESGTWIWNDLRTVILALGNNFRAVQIIDPADHPNWTGLDYKVLFDPTDANQPSRVKSWCFQEIFHKVEFQPDEPEPPEPEIRETRIDVHYPPPTSIKHPERFHVGFSVRDSITNEKLRGKPVWARCYDLEYGGQLWSGTALTNPNDGNAIIYIDTKDFGYYPAHGFRVYMGFSGDGEYHPSESIGYDVLLTPDEPEPGPKDTRIDVHYPPPTSIRELERFHVGCTLREIETGDLIRLREIIVRVYQNGNEIWEGVGLTAPLDGRAIIYVDPREFAIAPPVTGPLTLRFYFVGDQDYKPSQSQTYSMTIEATYGPFRVVEERGYPEGETYYGEAVKFYYWFETTPLAEFLSSGVDQIEDATYAQGATPLRMVVEKRSLLDAFGYSLVDQYRVELIAHGSPVGPWAKALALVIASIIAIFALKILAEQLTTLIWGYPTEPPDKPIIPCTPDNIGELRETGCPGYPDDTALWECQCTGDECDWILIRGCPKPDTGPGWLLGIGILIILGLLIAGGTYVATRKR